MFEFVLKPVNSDVIPDSFKKQYTIVKEHDTYCASASNKVIKLKGSSMWMKDEKEGIVTRKRSTSDIENCEENRATKKHKVEDEIAKPKDVAVCTNSNYIVDTNTVRKRGRPKVSDTVVLIRFNLQSFAWPSLNHACLENSSRGRDEERRHDCRCFKLWSLSWTTTEVQRGYQRA